MTSILVVLGFLEGSSDLVTRVINKVTMVINTYLPQLRYLNLT